MSNETKLALFVRESNWIEGIRRDPTNEEIAAHAAFLAAPEVTLDLLVKFVETVQPDARLRDRAGLNVYVGDHVPPSGGYGIPLALHDILERATDAYQTHVEYETLHPFTDGNGRSGRVLWLRMMSGEAPLGFLHHWYYQSLAGSGYRGKADTSPAKPITMQDVRLAAGEGALTAADVLAGCNAELRRRAALSGPTREGEAERLRDSLEQALVYLDTYKLMPNHKREQFRAALAADREG